jgi:single-stranded-DNA-specific exonuclease
MRWNFKSKPDQTQVSQLQKELQVDELIAKLLVQRGITNYQEAKTFFRPQLSDLHDPFLMKDMDKAVIRIQNAIQNQENIMVFGDYDVDGTTAVSLVASYLKSKYSNVCTYIPDRYDEGYGISFKGIDYASDNEISLIIALDCGIKSIDHIAYAKEKSIDFIICDHHRPGDVLPNAVAVLDPKRDDCNYPFDELCGCGIGFKLIQALAKNYGETTEDLQDYLDLVATAIAADIVPINGENRILAYFGLQVINSNPRPGLKALMQNVKKETLNITDVVFILAPRINAAGRIKHGNEAVALLSEYDLEQAEQFASEIESYNVSRKELDQQITKEALVQILENNETEDFTSVVYNENWHKGVIGIVASRLTETYYRPTLVFTKSGDKLAASARSVIDFDVYNAIDACSEYLEQFGGHKYAAGMTIKEENFLKFKQAFEDCVKSTMPEELRTPEIAIDTEIEFSEINPKMLRVLKQFEPFGPENRTPVFYCKNAIDTGYAKTMGKGDEHLKLFVKQENQTNAIGYDAIGFGFGKDLEKVKNRVPFELVFSIDENEFQGKITPQIRIKDLK